MAPAADLVPFRLLDLPPEVPLQVFHHLDDHSLSQMQLVSRATYSLIVSTRSLRGPKQTLPTVRAVLAYDPDKSLPVNLIEEVKLFSAEYAASRIRQCARKLLSWRTSSPEAPKRVGCLLAALLHQRPTALEADFVADLIVQTAYRRHAGSQMALEQLRRTLIVKLVVALGKTANSALHIAFIKRANAVEVEELSNFAFFVPSEAGEELLRRSLDAEESMSEANFFAFRSIRNELTPALQKRFVDYLEKNGLVD